MQLLRTEVTWINVRTVLVEVVVALAKFGKLIGNDISKCRSNQCIGFG